MIRLIRQDKTRQCTLSTTHVHNGTFVTHSSYGLHAATACSPLFSLCHESQRPMRASDGGFTHPLLQLLAFSFPSFEFSTDQRHVRDGLAARPILAWLEYRHSHPPRCAPRLALPDGDHPLVPGTLWTRLYVGTYVGTFSSSM